MNLFALSLLAFYTSYMTLNLLISGLEPIRQKEQPPPYTHPEWHPSAALHTFLLLLLGCALQRHVRLRSLNIGKLLCMLTPCFVVFELFWMLAKLAQTARKSSGTWGGVRLGFRDMCGAIVTFRATCVRRNESLNVERGPEELCVDESVHARFVEGLGKLEGVDEKDGVGESGDEGKRQKSRRSAVRLFLEDYECAVESQMSSLKVMVRLTSWTLVLTQFAKTMSAYGGFFLSALLYTYFTSWTVNEVLALTAILSRPGPRQRDSKTKPTVEQLIRHYKRMFFGWSPAFLHYTSTFLQLDIRQFAKDVSERRSLEARHDGWLQRVDHFASKQVTPVMFLFHLMHVEQVWKSHKALVLSNAQPRSQPGWYSFLELVRIVFRTFLYFFGWQLMFALPVAGRYTHKICMRCWTWAVTAARLSRPARPSLQTSGDERASMNLGNNFSGALMPYWWSIMAFAGIWTWFWGCSAPVSWRVDALYQYNHTGTSEPQRVWFF